MNVNAIKIEQEKKEYHALKREHEIWKVQQETILATAVQDVKVTNQGREADALDFKQQQDKLIQNENNAIAELRRVRLELKEVKLRVKQMVTFQEELRAELEQAHQEKTKFEAMKIESQSNFKIEIKGRIV